MVARDVVEFPSPGITTLTRFNLGSIPSTAKSESWIEDVGGFIPSVD
jgi:hypothetical protein